MISRSLFTIIDHSSRLLDLAGPYYDMKDFGPPPGMPELGEPTAPRSKVENGSLPHESGAIPVRTIHEFQLANDFRAGSENIFTVRLVRTFSGNWFVHVIPFLSQDRRGDNRLLDMGEALHDLRPREAQGVWP